MNEAPPLPETLTLAHLGALVGRDPQTIRLHIRHGRLPAEKFPGANGWRVRTKDARRWAARYLGLDLDAAAQSRTLQHS